MNVLIQSCLIAVYVDKSGIEARWNNTTLLISLCQLYVYRINNKLILIAEFDVVEHRQCYKRKEQIE